MKLIDVTDYVEFHNPDDELLPVVMCVCGRRFEPWQFSISIYDDEPHDCPECGAKLVFHNAIRVYQIKEGE